ncbi:ABC transporter substrate-binding protein [Paenibacillus lycopersici]|uniref:ABC transporter substrate-binding protein n=1 Tax=Paenibacillus lycopersici TaxID=2704462 RepID=A0A6C0G441_9BACL|nr:ABC transporter substrate-binding protein [Paenibacillus lycopersici]QHT61510.1 ABC transporter substrate-binding protein [Paenibacillus lycopersici]
MFNKPRARMGGFVLASAFALTAMLSGCGSDNSNNGSTAQASTNAASSQTAANANTAGGKNAADAGTASGNSAADAAPADTAPKSDKLVVYAALNEDDIVQIQKQFKADTGINIEYIRLSGAGDASTRVQAEKNNPQADIMVGGSVEFYDGLSDQGLLEAYTSPNAKEIDARFNDPKGFWQGWYMGVLGIVLNKDRFEKELAPKGVKEPQTWDDLLDPNYKGKFITSNPATAGGGYIFAADQLFRLGDEKGWDYLKKLNANVHHYTPAAGDGITLTATGEFLAGMAWAHDIVKAQKQGYPIKVVIPKQTAFEIGGVGIVKGGANTDNAKTFVDWLLTQKVGEMNTKMSNRYSVRGDVAPPEGMVKIEDVDLVNYDRAKASAMKADVVQKFTDMIGK